MRHTDKRGLFCTSFVLLIMAVSLVVSLSGCVGVSINSGGIGIAKVMDGEGEVITQTFDVEDFDKVRIDGDYVVVYTEAAECSISVEMQESLFDYIKMDTNESQLRIWSENYTLRNSVGGGADLWSSRAPRVTISAPTLTGLDLAGTFEIDNSSPVTGESFALELGGSGDVTLELAVEKLMVDVAGAGNLNLSGTATDAKINISGSGDIEALGLSTQTAEVDISGAGTGSITCSETLDRSISGSGFFDYAGDAVLSKDVTGLAIVEKVG
jgi:hypothetical protein